MSVLSYCQQLISGLISYSSADEAYVTNLGVRNFLNSSIHRPPSTVVSIFVIEPLHLSLDEIQRSYDADVSHRTPVGIVTID